MAASGSLEEMLSSCLSPENLRRTHAEAALKVCKDTSCQAREGTRVHWRAALHCLVAFHQCRRKLPWQFPCKSASLDAQAACKNVEVLPHLLATVRQSQSPEVQLLAAQTLRKHIPRYWRRLDRQVRPRTSDHVP
jgi:hypothetical protein